MPEPTSAFRRSLPLTLTSFINKAGTIGLSIIPVILVERHIGAGQSAWVMGSIKVAGLFGILLGGRLCDLWGLRATLLLSFVVSGLGMLPLPFVDSALLLGALGALSQFGTSFYYASARLLVTQLVGPGERSEAIAWQRTGNNLAQILSFSLGALLGRFGTAFLLLFDAFTSFLAAGVGARILPGKQPEKAEATGARSGRRSRADFYKGALIIAMFTFLYELYMASAAAECKVIFGTQGLQIFSQIMLLNTLLCAIFSIYAARHLTKAQWSLPAGIILVALGSAATFGLTGNKGWFFVGGLLVTLGEIVFNALAGMVLIVITPPGKRQASLYSRGVLLQFLGRIAGAAAAFPLVVHGEYPLLVVAVGAMAGVVLCVLARTMLQQAR